MINIDRVIYRRVEKIINGGRNSMGFMFSNCHSIFILMNVGNIVIVIEIE